MDVARKVVILARECGLQVDLSDVTVNSLVPPPLETASSAEHFLASLVQASRRLETMEILAALALTARVVADSLSRVPAV